MPNRGREGRRFSVRADVGLSADRDRMVDEVLAAWGRIDVLVNNAGITLVGPRDLLRPPKIAGSALPRQPGRAPTSSPNAWPARCCVCCRPWLARPSPRHKPQCSAGTTPTISPPQAPINSRDHPDHLPATSPKRKRRDHPDHLPATSPSAAGTTPTISPPQAPAGSAGTTPTIVNISSLSAGYTLSTNRGDYCVSKAGLAVPTQLFGRPSGRRRHPRFRGSPRHHDTDMTAGARDRYTQLIADGLTPIRRWGTADDVGRAVALLVSGPLPFSTGDVLNIDGGFHLRRFPQ